MAGFDTEFVVAAAQVLDECVAADHDRRSLVGLQASHRPEPCFEPSVIALQAVVRVLGCVVLCAREESSITRSSGAARSVVTCRGRTWSRMARVKNFLAAAISRVLETMTWPC